MPCFPLLFPVLSLPGTLTLKLGIELPVRRAAVELAAASDLPMPRRRHHDMRLAVLFIPGQGIEAGMPTIAATDRVSSATTAAPSSSSPPLRSAPRLYVKLFTLLVSL